MQINDRTVWIGTVKDKERIFEEESVSELNVWVLVASFCWLLCQPYARVRSLSRDVWPSNNVNPLNPELNPICYLLALLGAHHFLHVSRIRVKLLTFKLLMSYIYGAPILDVSRSHTTTQHSR